MYDYTDQYCWSNVSAEIILNESHGPGSADWDTCHVAKRTREKLAIAAEENSHFCHQYLTIILPANGLNSLLRMKMVRCLTVIDGVCDLADDPVVIFSTGKLTQ